jgi:YD repeat-containing protein
MGHLSQRAGLPRRRRCAWRVRAACAIGLVLTLAATVQAQTRYVYDAAGRLVGAIDAQGRATIYDYDEVGNIVAIRRADVGAGVSVTYVNPTAGLPGQVVEIFGSGFALLAAQNQVVFNGAAAQIVSATATRLTMTVPVGATTGPISVTTPFGSAQSPAPFVIPTMTVAPLAATVPLGRQRQFISNVTGTSDRRATWTVAGIVGGSPIVGTITGDGLYSAPVEWPPATAVEIGARSVAFPQLFVTAAVLIDPPNASVVATPVDIRVTRPGMGDASGLSRNLIVATPPFISAVRPAFTDIGGLPLNPTVAQPPFISFVRPALGDGGGLGLNTIAATPPFISFVRPGIGDAGGLGMNVIVAIPPFINLTLPGTGSAGGLADGVTVAQPPDVRVRRP